MNIIQKFILDACIIVKDNETKVQFKEYIK